MGIMNGRVKKKLTKFWLKKVNEKDPLKYLCPDGRKV
jgi:hypothetical protein